MTAVSVIIPAFNEGGQLARTLVRLRAAGPGEVIVVDGGSTDQTVAIARRYADQVLSSARGRARQMNAGARAACGEVLVFLHADTLLPARFEAAIETALADPRMVGGRFDVRLDATGWPFRMIETLMNLRSRWTGMATGDQAIFVRSAVFRAVGGYAEVDLMEDLELIKKLRQVGQMACLRQRVVTSARRWQAHGVAQTIVLMWLLRLCHFFKIPPAYLKRFYSDLR